MQLHRVVVSWAGSSVVGRAVNVLHFAGDNPLNSVSAIVQAYNAINPLMPNNVNVTIPSSGDTIEDTTGTLVDVWTASGGGTFPTQGAPLAAAGVGACVTWTTGGIVNGRRLRGRTFLVPLSTACYEANGTLTQAALDGLGNFATQLRAAGPLAVWHRPTTKGGSDGNSYGVISHTVRDKVAYLSSRRD